MKHKKTYQYPWRSNNHFQILVDGTTFFACMLDEIQNAKKQILLEIYLIESGEVANKFIKALSEAKGRGIDVYVLLDEYGAKGLNDNDKKRLTSAGIDLLLYNPVSYFHLGKSLKRDHRKLLVIDNNIAFIGGAGITDEFSPDNRDDYWHDVMLKAEGGVVPDFIHSFQKTWNSQELTFLADIKQEENGLHKIKNKARVLISEGAERNEIIRAIIAHIRSSKNQVWLTSPYFISSWKIRRALRYASKNGVDVRLIFPGPYSDHKWISHGIRRYYKRLLRANIAIYEFQPRFTHSKIILCDNWFTIGSSNLDRWNQFLNLDTNIEIYDEASHKKIIELFESDFSKSIQINLKKWDARSFLQLAKETISGVIINVLGYIIQKFKR